MARQSITYAHGAWAASDAAWCAFVCDEVMCIPARADSRAAILRTTMHMHTHIYPPAHWKQACKRWREPYTGVPMPALQCSAQVIASESGLSRQQVRTAISKLEAAGLLIKLDDAHGRGEGRGGTSPTFTFSLYAPSATTTTTTTTTTSTGASTPDEAESARTRAREKWS